MVDEGVTFDASHPMHLHGHSFRVVGQGKLGKKTSVKEVKALDKAGTWISSNYNLSKSAPHR